MAEADVLSLVLGLALAAEEEPVEIAISQPLEEEKRVEWSGVEWSGVEWSGSSPVQLRL